MPANLRLLGLGACLLAAPASAQTGPCPPNDDTTIHIVAPTSPTWICFTSVDHDGVGIDNRPLITGYRVLIFLDGDDYGATPPRRPPIDVGKPAKDASGSIWVSIPSDTLAGIIVRAGVQPYGLAPYSTTPATFRRSLPTGRFVVLAEPSGRPVGTPVVGAP